MSEAFVIALLGAPCTGKTQLAGKLRDALGAPGQRVAMVPDVLREFCDAAGRAPVHSEHAAIALEQTLCIELAAADHDIVIADTTALMTAVHSELVFGDTGLYESALQAHRRCQLTLLTALDLPWQADERQRDEAPVRERVDAIVREALLRGGFGYSVVGGRGPQRVETALEAVQHAIAAPREDEDVTPWQWVCERCGDAHCERHLLPRIP